MNCCVITTYRAEAAFPALQITDMVQFFKNVALLGSLLIFVSARSSPKYKLA